MSVHVRKSPFTSVPPFVGRSEPLTADTKKNTGFDAGVFFTVIYLLAGGRSTGDSHIVEDEFLGEIAFAGRL